MSILRLSGVDPRGRARSSSSTGSTRRSRSATGSGSSARTAPARRRCCGSPPASTSRTAGEVATQARAEPRDAGPGGPPRRGVHGRAGPPDRRPPRGGPPRDGWPTSSPPWRPPAASPSRTTPSSSIASRSSAATRSTSASMTRCPASGSRAERRRPVAGVALGRRADPRGAGPARDRRPGPPPPRRADEPPRPRRPGVARGAPPAAPRRRSLVASHDRAFLDATVTRVWELRDRRLTVFRGDYTAYHRQREERDARCAAKRPRRTGRRSRRSASSSRRTAATARWRRCTSTRRGSSGSRPRGRGAPRRAAAAPAERRPRRRRPVALGRDRRPGRRARGRLPAAAGTAGEPVRVARAPFLAARRGERIGIVGPNGAGKTTLLRTIAGELPPLRRVGSTFGSNVAARLSRPAPRGGRSPARRSSTRSSRRSR